MVVNGDGQCGSYTRLIGFNPRPLIAPVKKISLHATGFAVWAKSSGRYGNSEMVTTLAVFTSNNAADYCRVRRL